MSADCEKRDTAFKPKQLLERASIHVKNYADRSSDTVIGEFIPQSKQCHQESCSDGRDCPSQVDFHCLS